MFRSLVLAFAALLMMGSARDRADVADAAERSESRDLDAHASWALPREARTARRRDPVSEL